MSADITSFFAVHRTLSHQSQQQRVEIVLHWNDDGRQASDEKKNETKIAH